MRIRHALLAVFVLAMCLRSVNAYWNQMSGLSFSQPLTSPTMLAYNVTIIAQSDPDGVGPAYLLNGVSNIGSWYQIGIAYNWSTRNYSSDLLGHIDGFELIYNVFDPSGTQIAPICYGNVCGGGSMELSGPVHNGDKVLLSLSMANNTVAMLVKDWNTGAIASTSFSAYGATAFEGTLYPHSSGISTGLMTEWNHNYEYYSDTQGLHFYLEQKVVYAPAGEMPIEGWLFLFKMCESSGCLDNKANLAYIIATISGQGNLIVYGPKTTDKLTQAALPYTFTSSDGQSAVLYANGTFVSGTLNPVITFTSTTTSTTLTTTSTTSTSTTTSASTTISATSLPANQTGSRTSGVLNSEDDALARSNAELLAIALAAGALAVYLHFRNSKEKRKADKKQKKQAAV